MTTRVTARNVSIDSSEAERLEGDDARWITTAFVSAESPNEFVRDVVANVAGQSGRLQRWSGGRSSQHYRRRFADRIGSILREHVATIFAISCREGTLRRAARFLADNTGLDLSDERDIGYTGPNGIEGRITFDLSLPTLWIAYFTGYFRDIEFKNLRARDGNIELLEWFIVPDMFGTDRFEHHVRFGFYVNQLERLGIPSRYVILFDIDKREIHPHYAVADSFAGYLNATVRDHGVSAASELEQAESYVWLLADIDDNELRLVSLT